jgi:hypothetical protein
LACVVRLIDDVVRLIDDQQVIRPPGDHTGLIFCAACEMTRCDQQRLDRIGVFASRNVAHIVRVRSEESPPL